MGRAAWLGPGQMHWLNSQHALGWSHGTQEGKHDWYWGKRWHQSLKHLFLLGVPNKRTHTSPWTCGPSSKPFALKPTPPHTHKHMRPMGTLCRNTLGRHQHSLIQESRRTATVGQALCRAPGSAVSPQVEAPHSEHQRQHDAVTSVEHFICVRTELCPILPIFKERDSVLRG